MHVYDFLKHLLLTPNQTPHAHTMSLRSLSTVRSLLLHRIAAVRSFSSAAAVAYESEWEEVDDVISEKGGDKVKMDTWGQMENRGVQWVFIGGAKKKSFYATKLAEIMQVPYISMGTLVRQELDPTSTLYVMIANAVNEGKLVPEDIIFSLLSKRLEEGHLRGESGFILDGIPRTQFQAEILDQIADVDLVVNFKSVEDSLVKNSFGFHTCSHCGKSFDGGNSESSCLNPCLTSRTRHSQLNPSTTVDIGGGHAKKLRGYNEQSKLEKYYRKQRKLVEFQVTGDPGETWRGLLAALHLPHIHAVNFSRKLIV